MRIARFVVVVMVAATTTALLASSRTPPPPPPSTDTLAVRVNLEFDPSITSSTTKMLARDEAAAIWKAYGVDLLWTDPEAPPALTLDAFVVRFPRRVDVDDSPAVLGHTTIAPGPAAPTAIRLSFDAVSSLVERRRGAEPLFRQREVGIALGRVLAHEVGHVLLGAPAYHDPEGLMRTTFVSDDLVGAERSTFRLMPSSVARLRVRVASLSRPQS